MHLWRLTANRRPADHRSQHCLSTVLESVRVACFRGAEVLAVMRQVVGYLGVASDFANARGRRRRLRQVLGVHVRGSVYGRAGNREAGFGAVVTAQFVAAPGRQHLFRRSFSRILSMRLRLANIGHLPDKIIHIVLQTPDCFSKIIYVANS